VCIDPHQTGFVGKGSDQASSVNFGHPTLPGRGSAVVQKILAPPYYSQRTVFASPLRTFFIILGKLCVALGLISALLKGSSLGDL